MSSPAAAAPSASGSLETHRLVVSDIEPLTEDSVAVTFAVPDDLRDAFAHRPGQHLILIHDGLRRTYSICSPAGSSRLRIGVKKVAGGVFSSWLHEELRIGDAVEVLPPRGQFTTEVDPTRERRYAAIVAGSGITPVLSLAATVLQQEPGSRFAIVYGNRGTSSIMFLEEVEDLKNLHPDRLSVFHSLSRESHTSELFSGRLDRDRISGIMTSLLPVDDVDEWFLCGPAGLVDTSRDLLREYRVATEDIHHEVFYVDNPAPAAPDPRPGASTEQHVQVTARLGARSLEVDMDGAQETILDAVLRARPDAPYACRGGVCGTCRALLLDGEVRMDRSYALETHEIDAGYVLTCQSRPSTGGVALDFDR